MDIIQRSLDPAYHGPDRLRENIIRACRGHPTLIYELINASADTSALINVLQASIVNYEVIQKASVQQYSQDQDDQYFTDRQYRRGPPFDRRGGHSNDRRGDDYSNDRRGGFRGRSNGRFQSNRRSKRCFVCGKPGC